MRTLLRRRAFPTLLAVAPLVASCHGSVPASAPGAAQETRVQHVAGDVDVPFPFPELPSLPKEAPLPPMRLTASDGTGLRLAELTARAVIEEPLAFTELHLVFDNPNDRQLEGNFSVTLPEGASLGRFAMKLGENWQEGEVVEKKAARAAYEDFLHRKQDPALLEQARGNEFTARVFPIPARGRKELILSYSQELTRETPYAIPLRGLPELGNLDVAVMRAGDPKPVRELSRAAFVPDADFRLEPGAQASAGLRAGNLVAARIRVEQKTEPEPLGATLVLVDTSASRALGFEDEVLLVKHLAERLAASSGPKTALTVVCFDQTTQSIFDGEAGSFGEAEQKRIRERQPLGASNLEHALAWGAEHAKLRGAHRVVLITDGVPTAGALEGDKLRAAAGKLGAAGVERMDALALGGIRDEALLHRLVTAKLPRDGTVTDGGKDMATIERRLTLATRSGVDVAVDGAAWTWPRKLDGVQEGDEVVVYADLPETSPVRISLGGAEPRPIEVVPAEKPLLERAIAQAKIAGLLERQGTEGDTADLQKQIVALSVGHRVLSPYTGLLVLETERDYARFDIDRASAADVLSIARGRIAVTPRSPLPQPKPNRVFEAAPMPVFAPRPARASALRADPMVPILESRQAPGAPAATSAPQASSRWSGPPPAEARGNMWGESIGDSFGAGGLGLAGIGEGGGGNGEGIGMGSIGTIGHGASAGAVSGSASGSASGFGALGRGHGRLGGSHRASMPAVRAGATSVSGRLPPEVIQRIVRPNHAAFRRCYEDGLRRNPNLAGRIAIRFVIGRDGGVSQAENAGSSIPDAAVNACIVRAISNLSFPQPEGGVITVVYPLSFSNDGTEAPPLPPRPSPHEPANPEPYTGRFKDVMDSIVEGTARGAIQKAYEWHREDPGDVMALVALGETLEAAGEISTASRAYGSIIDLFPARADLRRFAGERLERLPRGAGLGLALDTFVRAEEERPDHPSSHRLAAFAWLKQGRHQEAFSTLVKGIRQPYPAGRFAGVDRILREDLGLVAAAWIKAEPARRGELLAKLNAAGGLVEDAPSIRFVLDWQTDANDVDFHIFDASGGHAYYQHPELGSGGSLYADVTTGYGPECFTIRLPKERRSSLYILQAHYYSRGPMGYGMGKLEIVDHDGNGGLTFEERPFVTMVDRAFVELGSVKGPEGGAAASAAKL